MAESVLYKLAVAVRFAPSKIMSTLSPAIKGQAKANIVKSIVKVDLKLLIVRARVADLAIKISQHEHGVRSENDPEVC